MEVYDNSMAECRFASSVDGSSGGSDSSGGGGCLITTATREFHGIFQIFGALIVLGIFIIDIAGTKNS